MKNSIFEHGLLKKKAIRPREQDSDSREQDVVSWGFEMRIILSISSSTHTLEKFL